MTRKARRMRIKRTRTVNATTIQIELDSDGDVCLAQPWNGVLMVLAMSRPEAKRLAKILNEVADQ